MRVELALTRVDVLAALPTVARLADAWRTVVRRCCSNWRALVTLRDAFREVNERSGWRCA